MDTKRLLFRVNIVLVVAIIVSAAVLLTSIGHGPAEQTTPIGSISDVVVFGRTSVKVVFGNCSSNVQLSDCSIQLTSPDGQRSQTPIKEGVLSYILTSSVTGLTGIKVSSTGALGEGTFFTMDNYKSLQLGSWALKLIYKPTGTTIVENVIIVPDTANSPTGYRIDIQETSGSLVKLAFSMDTPPATAPPYCQLIIKPPNVTAVKFNLTGQITSSFIMEDGTLIQYVDQGTIGIIDDHDSVTISNQGSLMKGQWSAGLIYIFTEERFANVIFQVG